MRWFMLLSILFLAGCDDSESIARRQDYQDYRKNRIVEKICHDGTRIWSWNSKYWIHDVKKWPDGEVKSLDVCK
jgi:hypothetical protein